MLHTPFSPWPSFTAEEADAVRDVLLSNKVNYWTGTECRSFEAEFAAWAGVQHAVALGNGTLALDVVLKALDRGRYQRGADGRRADGCRRGAQPLSHADQQCTHWQALPRQSLQLCRTRLRGGRFRHLCAARALQRQCRD